MKIPLFYGIIIYNIEIKEVRAILQSERLLSIYTRLINGQCLNKRRLSDEFKVNERTIQRDIDAIRNFLDNYSNEIGVCNYIVYDRGLKGYKIEQMHRINFDSSEVLAISKILLDSKAFTKGEMNDILKRLLKCCVADENEKIIKNLIDNELYHYVEPRHKTVFIDTLWEIAQAISSKQYIDISYKKLKYKENVSRKLRPLSIIFNEFYFYLVGFIDGYEVEDMETCCPTIYRIDRIQDVEVLKEKFHIPYKNRFEEGQFRNRIQFMFGGKLKKTRFKYKGLSVEAVLDRLPTARILDECEGCYLLEAETFGSGIDMWLRSQGDFVEVISEN